MDYSDSAIGAITRGLFLVPESVDDYEDPMVQQALRNIDDLIEETKARKAARILELHEAEKRSQSRRHAREHKKHIPNVAAHELREIVGTIVPLLGRRYIALIGGAVATRTIADWVAGESAPSEDRMARLRLALRVAKTLGTRLNDTSARQWFLAQNNMLDGERPVTLLAMQPSATIGESVLKAATAASKNQ